MAKDNTKTILNVFNKRTNEIKKHFDKKTAETKRHFEVVAEDIKDEVKILSEQVAANTEKLEEHDQRFDRMESDIEIIKSDTSFIKGELTQKVSRDEFIVLEKWLNTLENRVKQLTK